MHADFDLFEDGNLLDAKPDNTGGHGGARAGAGRRPSNYVKPEETVLFDKARARNEAAKAGMNEIELKIKEGEYLSRSAFREVCATALAGMTQGLRSIPDMLERRVGLSPEQVEAVALEIDQVLNSLANDLEMFTEQAPPG